MLKEPEHLDDGGEGERRGYGGYRGHAEEEDHAGQGKRRTTRAGEPYDEAESGTQEYLLHEHV